MFGVKKKLELQFLKHSTFLFLVDFSFNYSVGDAAYFTEVH